MAQAQPVQKEEKAGPASFNLMKWIAENPDKLKPPLSAKTIFREDDFMVTVVGGPNARTDYHVNPTEEFFFQLKGTVNIRIQHEGTSVRHFAAGRLHLSARQQCSACAHAGRRTPSV